jgi:hypothetical protein
MRKGAYVDNATKETVSEWYERYYDWRELRPRGSESTDDSRGRFKKWIEPKLGTTPITKVTRDDLERIAEYLDDQVADEVIAAKTATNIWGEITVGFAFAKKGGNKFGKNTALRVLSMDPAEDAVGPDAGTDKQKPFLRVPTTLRRLDREGLGTSPARATERRSPLSSQRHANDHRRSTRPSYSRDGSRRGRGSSSSTAVARSTPSLARSCGGSVSRRSGRRTPSTSRGGSPLPRKSSRGESARER